MRLDIQKGNPHEKIKKICFVKPQFIQCNITPLDKLQSVIDATQHAGFFLRAHTRKQLSFYSSILTQSQLAPQEDNTLFAKLRDFFVIL